MRKLQGNPIFSPSDLITFMESEYAGWMDRFHLEFPDAVQPDQDTAEDRILQARGEEHERAFLRELTGTGHDVCDLKGVTDPNAAFEAMKAGREIIYQAALASGCFSDIADFLVRVGGHSALGNHYSVARQQGVWKSDADTVLVEIDSSLFFKPHSKMLWSPHAYAHWRGNPLVSTSSNLVHRFDCDDRVVASAGWAGGKLKTKHLLELGYLTFATFPGC